MMLDPEKRRAVKRAVLDRYARVAARPGGGFKYPTGGPGLAGLGYAPGLVAALPGQVLDGFCGVGHPLGLGWPLPGQVVLDVGCGAGVDTLLAASAVGPSGRCLGLDLSPDMLGRARDNARASGVGGAFFALASAEDLPVPDGAADLVVSNGALNLVVDKERALAGVWRALRPGGRLQVADMMLVGPAPATEEERAASWFR